MDKEKKTRCPKGQVRNKEGICVDKVIKEKAVKVVEEKKVKTVKVVKEKKVKTVKVKDPKIKTPKAQVVKRTKTMKKLTKPQIVQIMVERSKCIQAFREKL
jgi:hypothetical protein